MIYECPQNLLENKENLIFIEEDNIELYVKKIEIKEDVVYFIGSAIIDNEKYNDFTIEATLTEMPTEKSFETLLNAEWDFYDLVF